MADSERFHSLDALRAGALLLGIVLHATTSFWPGFREANWPISDESSSLTLSGLFFVAHIFRMSVFYAIAGFFAHRLLTRLGAWGLVKNRLRRIALPFVVSYVVVMPLLIAPFIWAMKLTGIAARPNITPPIPDPQMPPWGHLWFVYLLLVMYVLWMGARAALLSVDRTGATPRLIDRVLNGIVASRIGPLLLAAPAAVVLYYTPWWILWQGIPTPIMGPIPNSPALLAYGAAFAFGWFLHRQTALLDVLKRDWPMYVAAAVVLSGLSLWIIGARPQLQVHEIPALQRAVYSTAYNVAGWCWLFGLIGAAVRFLDRPSVRWRYLADASFFVYIMHLPVVYALQTWMIQWPLHWSVKYLLIVVLTTAITFAMYHYLVRSTFVGRFLNGRRYPRGGPTTSVASISPG